MKGNDLGDEILMVEGMEMVVDGERTVYHSLHDGQGKCCGRSGKTAGEL